MIKFDENKQITKEYKEYVSNLDRKDLEERYIGADILLDYIKKYVRTFKTNEITPRELCILNDIVLITEGRTKEVNRLNETDI